MRTHDTLNGGTVARLARMRRYRDAWNAKAKDGRTPLPGGFAGLLAARSHGAGKWDSLAHGIANAMVCSITDKAHGVSAPSELVAGWRDVGASADIVRMRHNGWFSDADQNATYSGHVWQLPAQNGSPCYVAGFKESEQDDYVTLERHGRTLAFYDDKEDAARAGDDLARMYAETEREYQERWQEASRAADDRDTARDAMKRARTDAAEAIAAMREVRDGIAHKVARGALDNARLRFCKALHKARESSERIAELDMSSEF